MTDLQVYDAVGHFFYVVLALGMLLLAQKNIWGWVFRFVGEAGWIWVGIKLGMTSIWGWGALFLFVEIYGFYSWHTHRKESFSQGFPGVEALSTK